MEKEVKIIGKFYMRNGVVIEEEVVFDKNNDKEAEEKFIEDMKYNIKERLREDCNFQFTFGYTTFRGKDISAVTFVIAED